MGHMFRGVSGAGILHEAYPGMDKERFEYHRHLTGCDAEPISSGLCMLMDIPSIVSLYLVLP